VRTLLFHAIQQCKIRAKLITFWDAPNQEKVLLIIYFPHPTPLDLIEELLNIQEIAFLAFTEAQDL